MWIFFLRLIKTFMLQKRLLTKRMASLLPSALLLMIRTESLFSSPSMGKSSTTHTCGVHSLMEATCLHAIEFLHMRARRRSWELEEVILRSNYSCQSPLQAMTRSYSTRKRCNVQMLKLILLKVNTAHTQVNSSTCNL